MPLDLRGLSKDRFQKDQPAVRRTRHLMRVLVRQTRLPGASALADTDVRYLFTLAAVARAAIHGYIDADEVARVLRLFEEREICHRAPLSLHTWDLRMLEHHRTLHEAYCAISGKCQELAKLAIHSNLIHLKGYRWLLSASMEHLKPLVGPGTFLGDVQPTTSLGHVNMPSMDDRRRIKDAASHIDALQFEAPAKGIVGWQTAFDEIFNFLKPHLRADGQRWLEESIPPPYEEHESTRV
ncbi:uncharacterized protein LTR77_006065 [Saxophila tyrrhenica]|uniref:Uncharacterized protein n=1 Tax=Saxophila tyrrhenica TaxID=1690608 RepID=A0AAV9P8Z3_9PEZI|nr:hypothetical protein LTR77_006065 [Saxophila tyrrhenica]